MRAGPRTAFAIVALACAAALAAALVSQHVFEMQPCPWCVLQRLVFVLIGLVGLAGALSPRPMPWRVCAALAGALGAAGVAIALWQHFVAASSASCDLTLADRIMSGTGLDMALPQVFAAFASCADAKVNLLGVPYEFWSLALYAAMAAAAAWIWREAGARR
ncbi:MAG: disulfide bond formation protein B [Burkholderiales bacterium]|nr:disulfide bond formation protein B [Burkholderiales bacterium]